MGGHQTNTSTHSKYKETIFNGGSTHCHKTFKQHNNTQGLYVSDNDSKNTSECHFKRRKIRPSPVYYDEIKSHHLDAGVFFVDIPTSTQPMELDGKEVNFYFYFILLFFFFALILTKINICLRWGVTTNLSMNKMSHFLRIDLKMLLLLGSQRSLP